MPKLINILIPAYNPCAQLIPLIEELNAADILNIIIVNDGSDTSFDPIFTQVSQYSKVILLSHQKNQGKGAALKTGFSYIHKKFPDSTGIVTADADGQHSVEDILMISNTLTLHPELLILGVRDFEKNIPLRSKIGNVLTRTFFKLIVGQKISDTQSGLRGIPTDFIPSLLQIKSNGYEYELDMLLMCKYTRRNIIEKKITTIYIEHNKSSHFNPVIDSIKIYIELFRYVLLSIATAIVDYTVFFITHGLVGYIFISQFCARTASVLFNYPIAKRMVFVSDREHHVAFPRYVSLVIICGFISYAFISMLVFEFGINVLIAKMISELILYVSNFIIQRDFIFTHSRQFTVFHDDPMEVTDAVK